MRSICPWCNVGEFYPGARRCSSCGASRAGTARLVADATSEDPPLTMGGQGRDAPTGPDWPLLAGILGTVAFLAFAWYWIVRLVGWCAS